MKVLELYCWSLLSGWHLIQYNNHDTFQIGYRGILPGVQMPICAKNMFPEGCAPSSEILLYLLPIFTIVTKAISSLGLVFHHRFIAWLITSLVMSHGQTMTSVYRMTSQNKQVSCRSINIRLQYQSRLTSRDSNKCIIIVALKHDGKDTLKSVWLPDQIVVQFFGGVTFIFHFLPCPKHGLRHSEMHTHN